MARTLSRRSFLQRAALGCSAAASPLMAPVSLAAAPWDMRLVVIVLRGGMDGLDVIRPYGAPEFAALRGAYVGEISPDLDLDGFYALHPALSRLAPLWRSKELGFFNAVSTPYRNRRSHFDGQDILEAGTPGLGDRRDGWLNRVLQKTPGVAPTTAFAVGRGDLKLLIGPAEVADWTPKANLTISPQAIRLAELVMQDDPALHAALAEAIALSNLDDDVAPLGQGENGEKRKAAAHVNIAAFVAGQLRADTRLAAFSINGWDTHARQSAILKGSLGRLADTILTIRDVAGPDTWSRTAIVAVTEFGRTARMNGTGGTDHGTGGAMIFAGGALRGGKVYGDWPGLDEADLYQRRDLTPTRDVRAPLAWILRSATGLDRAALEGFVFPKLDMGRTPNLTT